MSMNGCPLREWESDQIRVETTQVEADFLAKTIQDHHGGLLLEIEYHSIHAPDRPSHHIRRDTPAPGTADASGCPHTVPRGNLCQNKT